MKVLFLDFDGVLNSEQHFRARYKKYGKGGLVREFCEIASSNLLDILEKVPDAKIVVSSSWRIGTGLDELKQILKDHAGVDPDRVIDKTPVHRDGPRGLEIQEWLDKHPEVTSYVILDDDADMEHLSGRFVQTDTRLGLMIDKADAVVTLFAPTSPCDSCGGTLCWAGGGLCNDCLRAKIKKEST